VKFDRAHVFFTQRITCDKIYVLTITPCMFLIYVFTNSDSHEKCVYNFASLKMERTEELPVESIEPNALIMPQSQSHKNLLGGRLVSPNRRIMLFAPPF
jgi:hypothetical protein